MKNALITVLETICPNNVYLQGTLAADAEYPESFITFFTDEVADGSHFDDTVKTYDWHFSVIFYSSDPSIIDTKSAEIRTKLKAAGFIPQGKGNDIPSDRPSHTGWAMEFIKQEII